MFTMELKKSILRLPTSTKRGIILLLPAVVWVVAAVITSRARFLVTGRADPNSGYRFSYTMPSCYVLRVEKTEFDNEVEIASYDARPKRGISWLVQKYMESEYPDDMEPQYYQRTMLGALDTGLSEDGQGYITPHESFERLEEQERFLIDGCPATLNKTETEDGLVRYELYIKPKGQPILYEIFGIERGSTYEQEAKAELKRIKDSIRISHIRRRR